MKVAVMGAGAVGCYYGAMLARAGHAVTLIGRPVHVEAVRRNGLIFESSGFHGPVAMQATTEASGASDADLVLFCVKSTDTGSAGQAIATFLKPDATVLCLQNGVDNAERLQAVITQPAVPAVVYVASEMIGPGHVRHNGRGELIIGPSPVSDTIAAHFNAAAVSTTVSANVIDALWVKLVTNCAYNALSAVGEISYGPLLATAGVAEVMRSVIGECRAVAQAKGLSLPSDLEDTTIGLAATMPDQYSSTAQDLMRSKPTEIDYLNGYVARTGAALGIPTPVNLALQVIVKLREARQAASAPRS
jgi:2-dehydropantoate 2-reductase